MKIEYFEKQVTKKYILNVSFVVVTIDVGDGKRKDIYLNSDVLTGMWGLPDPEDLSFYSFYNLNENAIKDFLIKCICICEYDPNPEENCFWTRKDRDIYEMLVHYGVIEVK